MARDRANILTGIWGNPDIRALTLTEQGLYLQLWTHPDLTRVGSLDWQPGRLAQLSTGTSQEALDALIAVLESRLLVVVDRVTNELLVRPWLRHDGLLKQPKMAVSMSNAYSSMASNTLRQVVVHELVRLREEEAQWAAWDVEGVKSILKHPRLDPETLLGNATVTHLQPMAESNVLPMRESKALPLALPQTGGRVLGLPTTTTTTTEDKSSSGLRAEEENSSEKPSRRKPETKLSESWKPNARHHEMALAGRIDINRAVVAFRGHADTNDRRVRDWDAAFRTWLNRAKPDLPTLVDPDAWMQP